MPSMDTESAWSRALLDSALRDLPYKIETNEYGQLVMSPVKIYHGRMQASIAAMLPDHMLRDGKVVMEVGIETPKGVKVPDVAWISIERWNELHKDAEALPFAPELCVEVLSRSNSKAELQMKRELYFAHGALEVWICDDDGRLTFFVDGEETSRSELAPSFPDSISL